MRELSRPGWAVAKHAKVFEDGTADVRNAAVRAHGDGRIILGDSATIDGAHLEVGAGCELRIEPGCRLRRCKVVVQAGSSVSIGAGTTWESGAILATRGQRVAIGEDCMLSSNVVLRTADGHGIFDAAGEQLNRPGPVTVGDHVWLGNAVRVGKGTTIGTGTIVGQMSLAMGDLDSYSLYVGVPARPLRRDVCWSRTGTWENVPERFRPPREA